mmetsp:Transcript_37208/g.65334  ORF Transcript_37208/g.65334 Transcript_37208/m.65334 type:complete len:499 (+) Transcript_37208:63-1559(+)
MRPTTRSAAAILPVLASIICAPFADAFATARISKSKSTPDTTAFTGGRQQRSSFGISKRAVLSSSLHAVEATTSQESTGSITVVSTPPSWDELSDALAAATTNASFESPKALVTLYRDTNGWCPFCERVWLILRAKGIPYDEQLISLQNKPEWYKALVPTSLVPAVLFHGDDDEGRNERRIVWESSDIIAALDEEFPDMPKMLHDTREYEAAVTMNDDLTSAGFGFVYAGRNDTLTEEDKLERRTKFFSVLDSLDAALGEQQTGGGGFRLGKDFTAVDALMIPTLERWRYQLPLTNDIDIQEGRPALAKWFKAMDSYEPYSSRVAGDEYSWTATNSMFLRYFGGGEDKPEVAAAIQRADDAAQRLAGLFVEKAGQQAEDGGKKYSKEAAAKLVSNHEAVVNDCTRDDPKSQQHIERGSNSNAADAILRYVTSLLLSDDDTVLQAKEAPLIDMEKESAKDAATAARIVASRLCVPRDMSAPAATILRAALATVADRLEE